MRVDRASRRIAASADRIYRALTDASAVQSWLPLKGARGIIEAFERLAMSAELETARSEGRLGIYPMDLLRAASRRLRRVDPSPEADEPSVDVFDRFLADLTGQGRNRRSNDIARSCALALGQLGLPVDDKNSPGAACSAALFDTYVNHKDQQTRYFALLALGQIGGRQNRALLVRSLDKARGLDRHWCALAAGVHSFLARRAAEQAQQPVDGDRTIGELLFEQFKKENAPELVSALAVALGLDRHVEAVTAMRERLGEIVGGVPRSRREQVVALAREDLGDSAFEAVWHEGRSLPEHALLDLAETALAD